VLVMEGRASSPVQAERSPAAACGHSNSGFAIRPMAPPNAKNIKKF